jgi:ethanolamine utilization protein EutP (predicted NTPase)
VLGDKESGKTTLVAKLQGNEDPKKGAGLEYGYIDVRDEYRDGKNGMRNVLITVIMIYYIKCILHPNISKLI